MCASLLAVKAPSVIRRQLIAEGFTLGDSPAPLASCQVGLRLTALSLILACSVRFAGLNAAGATTTCDWSTCSLQASTARTSDAVRARRGLASGEHERKGGGRSRHGLRRAEAHRPPQIRICLPHLPPRRRRCSTRAADASPAGARAPCASVAPQRGRGRRAAERWLGALPAWRSASGRTLDAASACGYRIIFLTDLCHVLQRNKQGAC